MIDRDDHPIVKCDRVLTDDAKVGRLAATHLVSGRKAIARIIGTPIVHAKRRAEGYKAALKALGVGLDRNGSSGRRLVEEADRLLRSMKKLLALKPRIDAVFAANDPSAMSNKAIWDAGRLRVPDDIAIVSTAISRWATCAASDDDSELVARRAGQAGGHPVAGSYRAAAVGPVPLGGGSSPVNRQAIERRRHC